MMGGDQGILMMVRFAVALVLVVVVVYVGRFLRAWTGNRMGPGEWFLAGAIAWGFQGLMDLLVEHRPTLDIVIHDTYIVVGYIHAVLAIAVLFGVNGLVYLSYPLVTGRLLNSILGYAHFWVSHAALFVVVWMEYFDPRLMPRRYIGLPEFGQMQWASQAYLAMAIAVVAVQVLFVLNLMLSSFGNRSVSQSR